MGMEYRMKTQTNWCRFRSVLFTFVIAIVALPLHVRGIPVLFPPGLDIHSGPSHQTESRLSEQGVHGPSGMMEHLIQTFPSLQGEWNSRARFAGETYRVHDRIIQGVLSNAYRAGTFRAWLPDTYHQPFLVEGDGVRLGLRAIDAGSATLDPQGGTALYSRVYPDTDVVYTAKTGHLKEWMFLESPQCPRSFAYELSETSGVDRIFLHDGEVRFVDRQGRGLRFLAPWIMDAAGTVSRSAARWNLVRNGEGEVKTLTLTIDPAGLVWPLLVDPSITTVGSMVEGRRSHNAILLTDGKVLLMGGDNEGVPTDGAELYDTVTGTWTSTGSMSTPRTYLAAVLLRDGRVLVTGGVNAGVCLTSCEIYNPNSGTWSGTGSLTHGRYGHTATRLPDGRVIVAGGQGSAAVLDSIEIYDPATGTWSEGPVMNVARNNHTATLLQDGTILVAGGEDSGTVHSDTEVFDPIAGTWTDKGPLGTARYSHTATLLYDGTVLAAGGFDGAVSLNSCEIYDPVSGTWSSTGSLNTARQIHTATLLPNGTVLVGGGNATGMCEVYDPSAGTWSPGESLSLPRMEHAATLLPGGFVLFTGGEGAETSSELYDPEGGSWSSTGSLAIGRYDHTATILPDGRTVVTGGYGSAAASVEIFDLDAGTWSAAAPMQNGRGNHVAVLLDDGKILVAGGWAGGELATAELYDPDLDSWSFTGSMNQSRRAPRAVPLKDGRVLLAGGVRDGGSTVLNTCEIYDPKTGAWTWTGSMSHARYNSAMVLLPDGRVLSAGGQNIGEGYLSSAEIYNPISGTWSDLPDMGEARTGASAVLLPSGKALISGGYHNQGTPTYLSSCLLFDPDTDSWSFTGSLSQARQRHITLLLPSGEVLAAGGVTGTTASAEIYRPWNGTWISVGSLFSTLYDHTVTLLLSGQVLLAGGYQSGATALCELFDPDLGYDEAWRPILDPISGPLFEGDALELTGSGFEGLSGASGGTEMDSATNHPLVQVLHLTTGELSCLPVDQGNGWSDISWISPALSGLTPGWLEITVYSNAIPSESRMVRWAGPGADLGFTALTDVPDPVITGADLTITADVSNAGPEDATSVVLTETYGLTGTTLTYQAGESDPRCSWDGPSQTLTCTLPLLSGGSSDSFSAVFETGAEGSVDISAALIAYEPDPDSGNNTAFASTSVTCLTPGVPLPVYPESGTTGIPFDVDLSWTEASDTVSYNLYFGSSSPPPLYQSGITDLHLPLSGLDPGTDYFWIVEAVNGCDTTSSAESTFTTTCMDELSRHPGGLYGQTRSSRFVGDYLYAGSGTTLQILDVSDLANPLLVNEIILPSWIDEGEMVLDGTTLYVPAQSAGILIYDVSDPENPSLLSVFDTPGYLRGGMEKDGTLLYAADSTGGVAILDVSDPSSPTGVGTFAPPPIMGITPDIRDVAVSGSYLYAADIYMVLWIVDITDPSNPVEISHLEVEMYPECVTLDGSDLYLIGGVDDYATQPGLRVYDLSTPAAPAQIGTFFVTSYPEWIDLQGSVLYMVDGSDGLRILDVSNPAAPTQIGQYDNDVHTMHVALSGARASLSQEYGGVTLLDVTTPASPVFQSTYDLSHSPYLGVSVTGSTAYISASTEGMVVLDLSDPSNPVESGTIQHFTNPLNTVISGNYLYQSDWGGGFYIYDITTPLSPGEVGWAPYSAMGAVIQGDYACLASGRWLRILDVSDPANPYQVGRVLTPETIRNVSVSGRYTFAAVGSSGLFIADISNPEDPVEVAIFDTSGYCRDVVVSGGLAFLADGGEGLRVLDVSDPYHPSEIAFFDTPGYARRVTPAGGYLLLSDNDGLYLLDLSNPASPSLAGHFDTPGTSMDTDMMGALAVVADYENVEVFDLNGCLSGIPEPFNLLTPSDGAVHIPCQVLLDWEESAQALRYNVYLDTVNPPISLVAQDHPLSEVYVSLQPDMTYWWKVVAISPDGTAESLAWSFTTGGPGAFELLSPPNGAMNQPATLLLEWQASEGAEYYRVYGGAEDPPPLFDATVFETSILTGVLSPSTTYYWQVEAVNGCGTTWSKKFQFTTGSPSLFCLLPGIEDHCGPGYPGDQNGSVDPGETVYLSVHLMNEGPVDATGVSASIPASSPGITILRGWSSFPDIPAGEQRSGNEWFAIQVDETLPCGTAVRFDVDITANEGTWQSSFNISIGQIPGALIQETFEAWSPSGWDVINNGGACSWTSTELTGRSNTTGGSGYAATADSDLCGNGTTMDTELRTSVLDFSQAQTAELSFFASYRDNLPGGGDYFDVDISTDGGSGWITLLHWDENHSPAGPGEAVSLNLDSYLGSEGTILRFHYVSPDWTWYIQVDDVHLSVSPLCFPCTCPRPGIFDLAYPNDGLTGVAPTAPLIWTESSQAESYSLYFGDTNPPPLYQSGLTERSLEVSGLNPGTTYFWYVEAINDCGVMQSPLKSFTTTCMNQEGNWPGVPYGETVSCEIYGNYLYVPNGNMLQVVDISNPLVPVKNYEFDMRTSMGEGGPVAAGGYLYLPMTGRGLGIYDLSDPSHPSQIGLFDTPGSSNERLEIQGTTAYLCDGFGGFHILDVSTPSQPVEIGSFALEGAYIRDVAVSGSYAYLIDTYYGLRVLNLSDPYNPVEVSTYETPGYSEGVALTGTTLLLADGGNALLTFDVSVPDDPTYLASFATAGYTESVRVEGVLAYVADGTEGVRIINIADPSNPYSVGYMDTPGYAFHTEIDGSVAYVANTSKGVRIIDISDPTNPSELSFFDESESLLWDMTQVGDYLYVSAYYEGIYVFDLSDPLVPVRTMVLDLPLGTRAVNVDGAYAYVANSNGTWVLDVTDPSTPAVAGNSVWWSREAVSQNGYAYLAVSQGIGVVDVSDPVSPVNLSYLPLGATSNAIHVVGPIAYIASADGRMRVVDVSDPYNPYEIASIGFPEAVLDVLVRGSFAYVAASYSGLHVVDVSDPYNPTEVSSYTYPFSGGYATSLSMEGSILYLSDRITGIRMVDVSNPYAPAEIGAYDTPINAMASERVGVYLYVSDYYGMDILNPSGCCSGPPAEPALQFPAGGETHVSCDLTLDWSDAPGAEGYNVYVDTVDPPGVQVGSDVTTSEYAYTLASDTTYYWRVEAFNSCGSTVSPSGSFTTGAPDAVTLLFPPDGSIDQPFDFTLDWDDVPGATSYDVAIDIVNPPAQVPVSGLGMSQTDLQGLPPGTTFYWKVIAYNGCDQTESSIWSFTTCGQQPSVPNTLFPADGAAGQQTNLVLDWEDCTDTTTYTLYFGTESPPPLLAEGLTGSSYPVSGLSGSTTYFWYVEAVASCSVTTGPESSFETTCMNFTSQWPDNLYGTVRSLTVNGTYAYMGNGFFLQVIDISDSSNPVKVNEILLPNPTDEGILEVRGSVLYVCDDSSGLLTFNLTDPAAPVLLGSFPIPSGGSARGGMSFVGDRLYLAVEFSGLFVLDVTDPAHPFQLGFYALENARDVEVSGDYVYVVDAYYGLRVLNVSDPASIYEEAMRWTYSGYAEGLELDGTHIYFADGNTGLIVYELVTPTDPQERTIVPVSFYAEWVEVSGTHACVSDSLGGIQIVNITTPDSAYIEGSYDTPGNAFYALPVGTITYVADNGAGMRILDTTQVDAITELGSYDESYGDLLGIDFYSGYAVVTSYLEGLKVYDISNPAVPVLHGEAALNGSTYDVTVRDGYAYVADLSRGLVIVDLADPANPVEIGHSDPYTGREVTLDGSYAYLAANNQGIRIFDVSDPASPVEVGARSPIASVRSVDIQWPYLYAAARQGGFRIFDVFDPANPVQASRTDLPAISFSVRVSGTLAYVGAADGLYILDVSDTSSPSVVGYFPTSDIVIRIFLSASQVFASTLGSGLLVIDVSIPASPFLAGAYDTPDSAMDTELSGFLGVVADTFDLTLVDFSGCCSGPPGPFSLSSPGEGEDPVSCNPDLDWEDAEGALTYSLYLDTVNPPEAQTGTDLRRSNAHLEALLPPNTTFFWTVEAHNACGTTATEVRSFSTGNPAAFSLLQPSNGETNVPIPVSLDWNPSPGAQRYDLYLGTGINPPLYLGNLPYDEIWVSGLSPSTTYTWYVVALNGCGSIQSQKYQFTTGAAGADFRSFTINDQCMSGGAGNGDGVADPGETIQMWVNIQNVGTTSLTGISGVLTCTTPGVTIQSGTIGFPDLIAGEEAQSLDGFIFDIDPGLACMTNLDFSLEIQASEGTWSEPFQVQTGAGETVLIDETFETWPPDGWSVIMNQGCDWTVTSVTGRPNYAGGEGDAAVGDSDWCGGAIDAELWTPWLDLPEASSIHLEFTGAYHDAVSGEDLFSVEISTDGGGSWAPLLTWDEDHSPYGPGEPVSLDLTAYSGFSGVIVRFHYVSPGWYWYSLVDSVRVRAFDACRPCCAPWPFSIQSPGDGATDQPTDIILDWQDSNRQTSYDLYLGTTSPPPLYRSGIQDSHTFIEGLEHSTTYFWNVVGVNGCGGSSTGEHTFTTGCVEKTGSWSFGVSYAVDGEGNLAVVASGAILWVVDLSDPDTPLIVGQVSLPDTIRDVILSGTMAYVADDRGGLQIVNLSNPASPFVEGFYSDSVDARGLELVGNVVYVAGCWSGFWVMDVSNPAVPVLLGQIFTSTCTAGVAVDGTYAYLASNDAGLGVIDVSDPYNPSMVTQLPLPGWANNVRVSGGYAWMANADAGLRVIDISDPANPFEETYLDTPGNTMDLVVSGNELFLADDGSGLVVVNITDPLNPLEVTTAGGSVSAVSMDGSRIFVGEGYSGGFTSYDVSTPSAPVQGGRLEFPSITYDVTISGSLAYIANDADGLRIVDLSDPVHPMEIGRLDLVQNSWGLDVRNNRACVVSGTRLDIVDVSTPSVPIWLGGLGLPDFVSDVVMDETYAYVADSYAGLRIIDISDPATPVEVGFYDTAGETLSVTVWQGYAYIADGPDGLRVLDISNPANPAEAGWLDTPGHAMDIVRSGDQLYLADSNGGVRIIDITDPANPLELGFLDSLGGLGVAVSGTRLYTGSWDGLHVLDVANSSAPVETAFYPVNGWNRHVSVSGNYAAVAQGESGFRIFDIYGCCVQEPESFTLVSPADGASDLSTEVFLTWNPSPGSMDYEVYLDTVNPPASLAGTVPGVELAIGLLPGTTYFWKVHAINGCGTAESPVWSFTTSAEGPMEVPKDSLLLQKSGGDIHVTWGETCGSADDYTVYAGDLAVLAGGTYSHESVLCSDTGGDRDEILPSLEGNIYVLVVPRLASGDEGDYGFGRPQGADTSLCGIGDSIPGECP